MKFTQIRSGSKANLYTLDADNGNRLLIECGLPYPKLLDALDYKIDNIKGCIISHFHGDHSKSAKDLIKNGMDVYASEGTLRGLKIQGLRRTSTSYDGLEEHGFKVVAFDAQHDCEGAKFFIIGCDGKSMLFSTDNYWIDQEFRAMQFNIIALECSFDEDILQRKVEKKEINEELAKRLLFSHMSNKRCHKYLDEKCDLGKCEEIHLLHMSGSNIVKDRVRQEFEDKYMIETFVVGD